MDKENKMVDPFDTEIPIGIDGQPINTELTMPTMAEQLGRTMNNAAMKSNSFMEDRTGTGRTGRFPGSRDWDFESLQVPCDLKKCVANHNGICLTPTLIKIGGPKGCKA